MSTCRGCGKEIRWVIDPHNTNIPLDMRPPIYQIVDDPDADTPRVMRVPMAGVSHFATCPQANQFTKATRAAREALIDALESLSTAPAAVPRSTYEKEADQMIEEKIKEAQREQEKRRGETTR